MTKKLKSGLVAAAIAAIVGLAVTYGLISQETGDEIRTQTDQILNEDDTTVQPPDADNSETEPTTPQNTETQPPAETTPGADQPTE